MVLLGYGSNNRRWVLQKVEWTVCNSDRKHLEQRVLPAIHQLVIASVVIPLRTWGKQEEVKTAWFLTRLPHSVGSWCSLDCMNGDCRDGCLKKKKIRSWKIGGVGWGGGWRISRNREYCKMGESLEMGGEGGDYYLLPSMMAWPNMVWGKGNFTASYHLVLNPHITFKNNPIFLKKWLWLPFQRKSKNLKKYILTQ